MRPGRRRGKEVGAAAARAEPGSGVRVSPAGWWQDLRPPPREGWRWGSQRRTHFRPPVSRVPAGAIPISRSRRLRSSGTASCSKLLSSGRAPEQLTGLGVTELGTDVPGPHAVGSELERGTGLEEPEVAGGFLGRAVLSFMFYSILLSHLINHVGLDSLLKCAPCFSQNYLSFLLYPPA